MLAIRLPLTALIAIGVQRATGSYSVYLHLGLLIAWLVGFTTLAMGALRVICPDAAPAIHAAEGFAAAPNAT